MYLVWHTGSQACLATAQVRHAHLRPLTHPRDDVIQGIAWPLGDLLTEALVVLSTREQEA
jgi:hypothetical protein